MFTESVLIRMICEKIKVIMNDTLIKITAFADKAHGDQRRKYRDERYINHPVRVMQTCEQYLPTLPVLAAALLHDVLEDTDTGKNEMRNFLLTLMNDNDVSMTMRLVIELTDVYTKEDYPRLNRRKRKKLERERLAKVSAEAQTIKYADIIDNSTDVRSQDNDFALVFLNECKLLLEVMTKGNKELRGEAMEVVDEELHQLEDN